VVGLSFMGKDAYRVDAFLIQGDIDDPCLYLIWGESCMRIRCEEDSEI
jgi:hypothetical protein